MSIKKKKARYRFILTEHFNWMNTAVSPTAIFCQASVLSNIMSGDVGEVQDASF